MPRWCDLCKIKFDTDLEFEVHELSLSHHIKIAASGMGKHSCHPCNFASNSLSEYSKHVDTEEHRRKRDRLRAIIDSVDAGEETSRTTANRGMRRSGRYNGDGDDYLQPTSSFTRNSTSRMTYPTPNMQNLPSAPPPLMAYHDPSSRYHTSRSQIGISSGLDGTEYTNRSGPYDEPWDDTYWNDDGAYGSIQEGIETGVHRKTNETSRGRRPGLLGDKPKHRMDNDNTNRSRSTNPSRSHSCYGAQSKQLISRSGSGEEGSRKRSRPSEEDVEVRTEEAPVTKKGFLERIGLRCSKDPKKEKKKEGGSNTKETGETTNTELRKKKKLPKPPLSIENKTKKWERDALKTNSLLLKSQRMMKERMNKYRLIDQNGQMVDEISEEDATSGSHLTMNQSSSSASNYTRGGQEVNNSQRRKSCVESLARPLIAPNIPVVDLSPPILLDDSISSYISMTAGTPKKSKQTEQIISNQQVVNEVESVVQLLKKDESFSSGNVSGGASMGSLGRSILLDEPDLSIVKTERSSESPPLLSPIQSSHSVEQAKLRANSSAQRSEDSAVANSEHMELIRICRAEMEKGAELQEMKAKLYQLELDMESILRRKAELIGMTSVGSSKV